MNAKHTATKLQGYLVSGYRLNEFVWMSMCVRACVQAACVELMCRPHVCASAFVQVRVCVFVWGFFLRSSKPRRRGGAVGSVTQPGDGEWLEVVGLIRSRRLIPC